MLRLWLGPLYIAALAAKHIGHVGWPCRESALLIYRLPNFALQRSAEDLDILSFLLCTVLGFIGEMKIHSMNQKNVQLYFDYNFYVS